MLKMVELRLLLWLGVAGLETVAGITVGAIFGTGASEEAEVVVDGLELVMGWS